MRQHQSERVALVAAWRCAEASSVSGRSDLFAHPVPETTPYTSLAAELPVPITSWRNTPALPLSKRKTLVGRWSPQNFTSPTQIRLWTNPPAFPPFVLPSRAARKPPSSFLPPQSASPDLSQTSNVVTMKGEVSCLVSFSSTRPVRSSLSQAYGPL